MLARAFRSACGAAAVVVAMTASADIPDLTLTQLSHTPPVHPRLIAAAPDGKVWFSDERFTPHTVGYYPVTGGAPTVFPIPCGDCAAHTKMSYVESITVGPDGNLWFLWTHVRADGAPLNDGMNSFVSKVTPAGQFTDYAVPTRDAFRRATFGAFGNSMIAVGPDGNLWFTEHSANKVGRITPSGVITEFSLAAFAQPAGITAGPDGNIWFTEQASGFARITRITPAGTMTQFRTPTSAQPYDIITGPDGKLWFTDRLGRVGSMTTSGVFAMVNLETGSRANHIAAVADGNLYFTYFTPAGTGYEGKVGRIRPGGTTVESKVIAPQTNGYDITAVVPVPAVRGRNPVSHDGGGIGFQFTAAVEAAGGTIDRVFNGALAGLAPKEPDLAVTLTCREDANPFSEPAVPRLLSCRATIENIGDGPSGEFYVRGQLPSSLLLHDPGAPGFDPFANSFDYLLPGLWAKLSVEFPFLAFVVASAGTEVSVEVTASGGGDRKLGNNTSRVSRVLGEASLKVTKTYEVNPHDKKPEWKIEVENRGTGSTNGSVTIYDTLAEGVRIETPELAGGSCIITGPYVNCVTDRPLAPGARVVLRLPIVQAPLGTRNVASAKANGIDYAPSSDCVIANRSTAPPPPPALKSTSGRRP